MHVTLKKKKLLLSYVRIIYAIDAPAQNKNLNFSINEKTKTLWDTILAVQNLKKSAIVVGRTNNNNNKKKI